jgi:hypothetical protein
LCIPYDFARVKVKGKYRIPGFFRPIMGTSVRNLYTIARVVFQAQFAALTAASKDPIDAPADKLEVEHLQPEIRVFS